MYSLKMNVIDFTLFMNSRKTLKKTVDTLAVYKPP